ncbi:MAG TPA: DUF2059 domain-containing protein [Caulobacter sp.]|nr:DUF2059 domain-containing protein [Caulobacter sp.]
MNRTISACFCAVAILLPAGSPAAAAEGAAAPSRRALDCARRYSDAMNMEETMAGMMTGMLPSILEQERRRSGASFTARQERLMGEAMTESIKAMVPEMMEQLTPLMAVAFTEDELCALADFYASKEGQSVIAKMPAFTASSMAAMQDFIPRFERDMEMRFCRKISCDPAKIPTPQPS